MNQAQKYIVYAIEGCAPIQYNYKLSEEEIVTAKKFTPPPGTVIL
jgi:hypothetical protein